MEIDLTEEISEDELKDFKIKQPGINLEKLAKKQNIHIQ